MGERVGIPDVNLDASLEALGLAGATLVTATTRATDTRVWGVSHNGRALAIRVFRESQQRAVDAENSAMHLAHAHGIPVPEIISTGLVDGRYPAMAIEWIPGELAGESMLRNPSLVRRLGKSAGELLARLHNIPVPDEPTGETLDWNWITRGNFVSPDIRKAVESTVESSRSLLHLDYHPHNLISNGGKVTGIIDWTNAVYGDPRADLAQSVTILQAVAPPMIAPRGAHRMGIGLFTRAFLTGYQSIRGELKHMEPFYAWSGSMVLGDLGPKIEALPVRDPEAFKARIERWTETWMERARTTAIPG